MTIKKEKLRKGFALLSPEQRKIVATKGGKSAHQKGTAHQWTSETALKAQRKRERIKRANQNG